VINGMVTFGPLIKSHGEGGHVVNTASMAGQVGMRGVSIYNTTKFAVVGMSESMRGDLERFGIGASVLCPGYVETDIFSSERNRPGAFGGADASKFSLGSDTAISELPGIISAQVIGDMVLHAIQNDVFYILSHGEMKEVVAMRGQHLSDAFDLWTAYRQEHNI